MRAYSRVYVEDAQLCLGEMLDCAVRCLEIDADQFFSMFIASGLAGQFEKGNAKYVAGMTGYDLAAHILRRTMGSSLSASFSQTLEKESWYWTGWILAYYQWHSCMSFARICEAGLTPSAVEKKYILHEADVDVFVRRADEAVARAFLGKKTNLQQIRKIRRMTQSELASASGVSLRMIQLYEQRQSNIDSAAAVTVAKLSHVLGCSMQDLLENPTGNEYEYVHTKL